MTRTDREFTSIKAWAQFAFTAAYPTRVARRAAKADEAFLHGALSVLRATYDRRRTRLTRAYLIGLRRGYRAGVREEQEKTCPSR